MCGTNTRRWEDISSDVGVKNRSRLVKATRFLIFAQCEEATQAHTKGGEPIQKPTHGSTHAPGGLLTLHTNVWGSGQPHMCSACRRVTHEDCGR